MKHYQYKYSPIKKNKEVKVPIAYRSTILLIPKTRVLNGGKTVAIVGNGPSALLGEYGQEIDAGRLPIFRGIELNQDDLIRRDVITRLICHFGLDFSSVEERWGIRFADYFASDMGQLQVMQIDGLLEVNSSGIKVMPRGRLLIRNICMAFDRYLPPAEEQKKFSRVI